MCIKIKCKKCFNITWSGCGKHLENLFKNIPHNMRCWCYYDKNELEELNKLIGIAQKNKSSGPFPKHSSTCVEN